MHKDTNFVKNLALLSNYTVIDADELYFRMALCLTPQIGAVTMRQLLQYCGSAKMIFETPKAELMLVAGVQTDAVTNLGEPETMKLAAREVTFMEKEQIVMIAYNDPAYPQRLRALPGAPSFLFYKGSANLQAQRTLGIVGTRTPTAWGLAWVDQCVSEMKAYQPTIISGMAFGIDGAAHRQCVEIGLPTIGVLGHGLDRTYPVEHRQLAAQILERGGGLLTEYPSGRKPKREHFPMRNRIIAGLSDALIVVESADSGGSMISAALATQYKKDLFAVPGRPSDKFSTGCNELIASGKAHICLRAKQITEHMHWHSQGKAHTLQAQMFASLNEQEERFVALVKHYDEPTIDLLASVSGLTHGEMAALVLNLEMKGVLQTLPGKKYRLLG